MITSALQLVLGQAMPSDIGGDIVEPVSGFGDEAVPESVFAGDSFTVNVMDLVNAYAHIFIIAFAVTLFCTPIVRRLAITAGIIDHPDEDRKVHAFPIAYLGGVAVFLGLVAAIGASYVTAQESVRFGTDYSVSDFRSVPIAIVFGMVAITITGLVDDIWNCDPMLKISGQLIAAAALAIEDVGVRVADGLLNPILGPPDEVLLMLGSLEILNAHLFYWVGTALVAVFVLGGCNAANFLDGLDGLLSGTIAIVAVGLLAISVLMATRVAGDDISGSLAGSRIVLCMALLGATLGFLPHNFNPASIFLGDCGSLLLGYMSVVLILMLGELGETHLVFAGLIVFSLPIMDTTLAIIRRILAGTPLSTADTHHIHHQLRRITGSVRRAVITLYGMSFTFATVGVSLAALVMFTDLRVRAVYAIAFVLFSFIGVMAVKAARRTSWERDIVEKAKTRTRSRTSKSAKPGVDAAAATGDPEQPTSTEKGSTTRGSDSTTAPTPN